MARINEILGMNNRDISTLRRLMNQPALRKDTETVAEYIRRTECRTERRIAKSGTEMIKVHFLSGKVAEYPAAQIDRTKAFD